MGEHVSRHPYLVTCGEHVLGRWPKLDRAVRHAHEGAEAGHVYAVEHEQHRGEVLWRSDWCWTLRQAQERARARLLEVRPPRVGPPREWTEEQLAEVRRLKGRGLTRSEIRTRLELSHREMESVLSVIRRRLRAAGSE